MRLIRFVWELLKIASRWKGAVFLFDGKEVDQEVWESSFQQNSGESGDEGEKAALAEKPEKAEEPPKVEEKKPEKAEEKPKPEEKKPPGKPVSVQINPAPKPEDNSGCGKSAAMFAIAALGLLQFFR